MPHAEIDAAALAGDPGRHAARHVLLGPRLQRRARAAPGGSRALGRPVKEMIGGFEYWVREGRPLEGAGAERYERDASGLVGL